MKTAQTNRVQTKLQNTNTENHRKNKRTHYSTSLHIRADTSRGGISKDCILVGPQPDLTRVRALISLTVRSGVGGRAELVRPPSVRVRVRRHFVLAQVRSPGLRARHSAQGRRFSIRFLGTDFSI